MNKEQLVDILKRILKTDADLSFLLNLQQSEIETLVAVVRSHMDSVRR